jgi:hypothetical protein
MTKYIVVDTKTKLAVKSYSNRKGILTIKPSIARHFNTKDAAIRLMNICNSTGNNEFEITTLKNSI